MKTYFKILQLHSNFENILYPDNNKTISNHYTSGFWNDIFLSTLNDNNTKTLKFQIYFLISSMDFFKDKSFYKQIHNKYKLFDNFSNNIFLSKESKDKIRYIFYKSQKTYLTLLKFANIIRHKISKEKVNIDLRMDIIDPYSKFSIVLYHHNSKYFFLLSDLINIIHNAITNSTATDIFSIPKEPKNPYNNMPFKKIDLYNIYYHIKFAFINVPYLIELYYLSDFNIRKFIIENEQTLREISIRNYLNNTSLNVLFSEIKCLLKYCNIKFEIHEEIPKKEIIDIFRPYLYLYFITQDYIEGTDKKMLSENILKNKMKDFYIFNPNFGKKNINIKKNKINDISKNIFYSSFTFNMLNPTFNINDAYNSFYSKKKYT
jgi:hypothetical protein